MFGSGDSNLYKIEKSLNVSFYSRGHVLEIKGSLEKVSVAKRLLQSMANDIADGKIVDDDEIDALIKVHHDDFHNIKFDKTNVNKSADKDKIMENYNHNDVRDYAIKTYSKTIFPRGRRQLEYVKMLREKTIIFTTGPAGTGKTYLAAAMAVHMLINKEIDRIILSRPAVEAGEKLGFLPGNIREKVDPYLIPLYDALFDMMPTDKAMNLVEKNIIEVAPLAFMRGRTLSNSFIILDEAQNTNPIQMKMFLTRLGKNSRMVVNGDLSQIDLPSGSFSGLDDAVKKLSRIKEVAVVKFSPSDAIRHELTAQIINAYETGKK